VSPRILLFDEQGVYRTGLHSLISSNMPRAEVVEAKSLNEALSQIRNDPFNLVILGVNLPSLLLGFLKAAREASPSTQFAIIIGLGHARGHSRHLSRGFARLHFEAPVRRRHSRRHHLPPVRADLCASLARGSTVGAVGRVYGRKRPC